MTRLAVSILATLVFYLAYQALISEALSTGGSKPGSGNRDTVDSMISDDNLGKIQNAWLKSAYNRRSGISAENGGRLGPYTILRRTPASAIGAASVGASAGRIPLGYLADISLIDDEDIEKRFDDYGHMRFGKRGGEGDQFDDYGHMRFGR